MATQTPNYNLIKPDYADPVDVDVLNDTADLIDSALTAKANLVGGKVPASELPSYVDDIIEGYYYNGAFYTDSAHTTPITGETGKIYVDLSTNKQYRWSGSAYVQIAAGGVDDVQDKGGNSLVNNGIAVIPVTAVEDEAGQSLVDSSGNAVIPSSPIIVLDFVEAYGSFQSVLTCGEIRALVAAGKTFIGRCVLQDGAAYLFIALIEFNEDTGGWMQVYADHQISGVFDPYFIQASTDQDVFGAS